jgi:hypothetical protein
MRSLATIIVISRKQRNFAQAAYPARTVFSIGGARHASFSHLMDASDNRLERSYAWHHGFRSFESVDLFSRTHTSIRTAAKLIDVLSSFAFACDYASVSSN